MTRLTRLIALGALVLMACPVTTISAPSNLSSFTVQFEGVFITAADGGVRAPLSVSNACQRRYDGGVPDDVRGTADCRYVIPPGPIEFDLTARALDRMGQVVPDFNGPVAFKVVPGQLAPGLRGRWAQFEGGELQATVKSVHQYGQVRVWVQDAPPELTYECGSVSDAGDLPTEPAIRSYASGLSQTIYFEDQTLQSLQSPSVADNRSSPFVGEFVTIGKNPESGERLLQNCVNDPLRNGQQSLMVVTGIDPSGFFVTDLTACRLVESPGARTQEPLEPCMVSLPDGGMAPIETTAETTGLCRISRNACGRTSNSCARYLPGTFGSMFVYNYNYPDGLNLGDLLFTVSGAVQEFTSTTQMVFPGWTIAESVRLLPPEQWGKWLDFVPPVEINARVCGLDDASSPFVTDVLCGMSSSNLKMESLESALVKLRGVSMPDRFTNCDFNGDGTVPFFCNRTAREQGLTVYSWGSCGDFGTTSVTTCGDSSTAPVSESANDIAERTCAQDCVLTRGEKADLGVCSESSTFTGFGQYVVEMAPAGPAFANLDSSLSKRMTTVVVPVATDGGVAPSVQSTGWVVDTTRGYEAGASVAIVCDVPVHHRMGHSPVVAEATDAVLPAKHVLKSRLTEAQDAIAFRAVDSAGTCSISFNPHMRINLLTKDAVPELSVDCSIDDANAARAQQCRNLRGATFDVVGHLRQVQPARPRWIVIPRAPDDLCCYPGPGLECPTPIKPCAVK